MLNTKEYCAQLEMETIQQEPLFTELTAEMAATVEGSGAFVEDISFSYASPDRTNSFYVPPGGNIKLVSNTISGKNNPSFSVSVRNVDTGNSTPKKVARVGRGVHTDWTGMRGGRYQLRFTEATRGNYVSGTASVIYS